MAEAQRRGQGPEHATTTTGPSLGPQVQAGSLASASPPPARPLGQEELSEQPWKPSHLLARAGRCTLASAKAAQTPGSHTSLTWLHPTLVETTD